MRILQTRRQGHRDPPRSLRTYNLRISSWLGVVAALGLAPHAGADPPTPYVKLPHVICEVEVDNAVCEGVFPQAPVDPCIAPKCPEVLHMDQAVVDADGTLKWRDANIGDPETAGPGWFVLGAGQTYHVNGWTVQRNDDGNSTCTNDATAHGMALEVLGGRGPMGEFQTAVSAF